MAKRRNVLITGATGKQGRALIRALVLTATPSAEFEYHVLALTRNASSKAARLLLGKQQELAARITIVQGDLNHKDQIQKIFEHAVLTDGVWGVFVVLAYPGLGVNADMEERQAKMLANLALEFHTQIFVYSSMIMLDPAAEDMCDPSHLAKRNIEIYCKGLRKKGLNLVILRPGFFMEVFEGFLGAIAAGMLVVGLNEETKIPIVASEDIGNVAAGIFRVINIQPYPCLQRFSAYQIISIKDHERFLGEILSVTSELATMKEIMNSYRRVLSKKMPTIPGFLARMLVKVNPGVQKIMMELDRAHQVRIHGEDQTFDSQVSLARSVCRMHTYGEWKSKMRPNETDERKWNNVSFFKLLAGQS